MRKEMKNLGLITATVFLFILGLGSLISFIRDFSLIVETSYVLVGVSFTLSVVLLAAAIHLGNIYFRRMGHR
ncbi:MAG: hypothetical protein WD898_01730 [Candidatus Paceibacterota bacterium]